MNKFVTLLYNDEVFNVLEEVKKVYEFIKDKNEFRKTDTTLVVNSNNCDIIDEEFSEIYFFKKLYNMRDFMLFLEYNDKEFYNKLPHSHNDKTSNGSIFFPIIFSKGVVNSFYEPPINAIKELKVGDVFNLLECNYDVPSYEAYIDTPAAFNINHFHKPTEVIKGFEDNYKRVICNWESYLNYDEIVEVFYDT
jgi:hypothetical protein